MAFSVLMSVYKNEQASFFKLALDSLLTQTTKATEIVIVQDGPLNNALDTLIASYQKNHNDVLKFIKLSENQGLGKALAIGLRACSNELVARMDTDDIAFPNRFEELLAVFKKHPYIDVVGSAIAEFSDNPKELIAIKTYPKNQQKILKYAKYKNPIAHPTSMFKKESVLKAGNYQHMPYNEDYFLWVRMLLKGNTFYNIQTPLLYFRISPKMYKRRGGIQNVKNDITLQYTFYKLGFTSLIHFLINSLIRTSVRLMPNKLRQLFYLLFLRKKQ